MRDTVYHMVEKRGGRSRGWPRKIPRDSREVDLRQHLGRLDDVASVGLREFPRRGGSGRGAPTTLRQLHTADDSTPGTLARDAEVQCRSVDDEDCNVERSRTHKALGECELRKLPPGGFFERMHSLQNRSDNVDGKLQPTQLEGCGKLEQVPAREAPTATSSTCVREVWDHDTFLAQVDKAMLRHAECPGGLGQRQPVHRWMVSTIRSGREQGNEAREPLACARPTP